MKAAGNAANGVVFPVRTAAVWGGEAPGMAIVREISQDVRRDRQRLSPGPLHRRHLLRAAHEGGDGLGGRERRQSPAEASERACTRRRTGCRTASKASACPRPGPRRSSRHADRRPLPREGRGATEASVEELMRSRTIELEQVTTIDLPRKRNGSAGKAGSHRRLRPAFTPGRSAATNVTPSGRRRRAAARGQQHRGRLQRRDPGAARPVSLQVPKARSWPCSAPTGRASRPR